MKGTPEDPRIHSVGQHGRHERRLSKREQDPGKQRDSDAARSGSSGDVVRTRAGFMVGAKLSASR